jgi:hypothetical protein
MSLLDTASLIVTPNGYKEGKLYSVIPSDGSGDLSVTRATTATRVNSAGLVELVPYNLLTYSEQFDNADWGKEFTTITANNITAPNGTATADRLNLGSGTEQKFIYQAESQNGTYTQSVYLKKGTHTFFQLAVGGDVNPYCNFDLTNGTYSAFGSTATIANVGDGWYRCTMTYTTTTGTYVYIFAVDSLSSVRTASTSSTGNYYAWGAQVVEGSTAKDYQKTETRLDIPRLDYSNGTCPSLLVEPQRTNSCLYSENFTNGVWFNSEVGITSGQLSPSGINNAFKITATSASNAYIGQTSIPVTSGNTYTASVYLKGDTSGSVSLRVDSGSTAPNNPVSYTTEWQRFTYTFTAGSTTATAVIGGYGTWNGTEAIYVYGFQLEAGSYATSYIPTTSASVTRNADVISKTGISSLIGQTEGTLFFDVYAQLNTADEQDLSISDGTGNNRAIIRLTSSGTIRGIGVFAGNLEFNIGGSAYTTGTRYKIALAYKNNDVALYVNGTSQGTSSSTTISGTLSRLGFDVYTNGAQTICSPTNAVALWKTRLTNTQLAQLTTI